MYIYPPQIAEIWPKMAKMAKNGPKWPTDPTLRHWRGMKTIFHALAVWWDLSGIYSGPTY